MSQKKLLFIANPRAGMGKIKNHLFKVVDILSKGGYEVTVYPTKKQLDAMNRIKEGIDEFEMLVVSGGDGTLNEVVNGVIASGADIPIGYIPAGTLNEWSSGLKISRNIEQAARDIVNGQERTLDVGLFDNRYFTYTASFGAFTEVSYSAEQDVKNVLGQAAYVFEGIKSIGNIKPIKLKLETEAKTVEGEFIFGAISNSMSVGGVLKLDENTVALNDGFFEVVLIRKPDSIADLQKIVDGILKKDFTKKGIEFMKAARITVCSDKKLDWTLDGEHARGEKVTKITNLQNRLKFIVPSRGSF